MSKNNAVDTWVSGGLKAQFGFLPGVIFALEQFSNGNRLPLTKMYALANGRVWKGENGNSRQANGVKLTGFAGPLKAIMAKTMSNAKPVFKDGKCKWEVGENGGVNADEVRKLRELVEFWGARVLHAKHKAFMAAYPNVKAERGEVTAEMRQKAAHAARKRLATQASDLGIDVAEFIRLIVADAAGEGNVK